MTTKRQHLDPAVFRDIQDALSKMGRRRWCCAAHSQEYIVWYPRPEAAGHLRRLSADEWELYRRKAVCPLDPYMVWVLSPLGVPVETSGGSPNHYACSVPGRCELSDLAACHPLIRAEGLTRIDAYDKLAQLLEASPEALQHILNFEDSPTPVRAARAVAIARAILARQQAAAALGDALL